MTKQLQNNIENEEGSVLKASSKTWKIIGF